ncbi:hypothetical protein JKP88DRAFT_170422 [Tribonema minus]|uniref:DUF2237 domain-containing protein n=1 Tax=Tribonema minus TaxID=303371 RepID=A0A835YP74_9STRA|nr:hypothetical protein JKP88DRAFT_170422 [Tribonema minus]
MSTDGTSGAGDLNVLGSPLKVCSTSPMTGFYRNGFCQCDGADRGVHSVCAILTDDFLEYTKAQGNDLSTPRPEFGFPGLKAGDGWCLCASRWKQAADAGHAPAVKLDSTNRRTLDVVPLEMLMEHAWEETKSS